MDKKLRIILTLMIFLQVSPASAAIPHKINYQGQLTDSMGEPQDGTYEFIFRIFDVETGGVALWTETQTGVEVSSGLFNVILGEIVPIDTSIADFDDQYWLEIVVEGERMTPRQALSSVGQAIRSENAEDVYNMHINPRSISVTGYGQIVNNAGQWVGDPTGLMGPTGPAGNQGPTGPQGDSFWTDVGTHIRPDNAQNYKIYNNDSTYTGLLYVDDTETTCVTNYSKGNSLAQQVRNGNTGIYASGASYGAFYYGQTAVYASGGSFGAYSTATNTGVFGSGGTYGLAGESSALAGVYGSGMSHGIYGVSDVYGVRGVAYDTGVHGSGGSYGLYGISAHTGLYGSGTDYGCYALSLNTGIYASGTEYGIYSSAHSFCGVYGYRYGGSTNHGESYADPVSAIHGYTYYGSTYGFGVYGKSYGDYNRTGGVCGYVQTGAKWGCLGYKSSSAGYYGGYFYGGYTGGAGKDADFTTGIGIGVYGGVAGAWIRGEIMGLYTQGEYFAGYSNGDTYTTGVMATLQETGDHRTAYYGVTSPDVEIMTHGTGILNQGQAQIQFDKDFLNAVSKDASIVVTVSPSGPCDQLFIEDKSINGFSVQEFNDGKSNVQFDWIAVGRRAGYERRPELHQDLAAKDFDEKMLQAAYNENDTSGSAIPIWHDGETLRWTDIPYPEIEKEPPETPFHAVNDPEQLKPVFPADNINHEKLKAESRNKTNIAPDNQ